MFKKIMSTFLVTLLTLMALPAISLSSFAADTAEEGEGNGADAIAEAFGQYQVAQTVVESSGGIDVPVKLTTYVKDKTAHNSETIFYVINHLEERIGQESDVSILTDYINENYIIVVADYQKHPNAIASKIEYSIQALRNDISEGKYIGDLKFAATYKSEINFMVPAGYRLARDITYFNLLDHGCKGTAELIVKAWNSDAFKNGKGSLVPACEGNNYEGGWFEATDITQLVRPDKLNGNVAIPLDFDLGLDIVYPSNPTRETPVTVTASSWEQREGVNLGSKAGLFATALVFRGFTCAVYSHEYYPMARDDHYGYWSGDYGLAKWNGVKTHTAAIRCIKYFSEQYGYSAENIGVGGGSKASYCSLLGQENPELRAELNTYTGTYDDQYGNVAQPWQTYEKSGEKIPSNVQAVYSYMGDGTNLHASIVNETTAPSIIACGYYDQFGCWDKWPACQETYMKWDVPHLAITMNDLGHVCPYGQDPDLDYERTQSAADFYDYWLNDAAPKLVYTYPVNNSTTYKGEDPIQIQFTGEFELSEISSKIKIVDVTDGNKELDGTWTVCAGNTKFEFEGPAFVNGHTYSIIIPDTLTDRNGKTIAEGVTRTFVSAADIRLTAVKDAYIVSGSSENKGTDTVIKLSGSTSRGYLEFDISSVKNSAVKTRLALDVTNDATNIIEIYALAEDAAAWQENTILWDNAPAYSTLIASVPVTGAGRYMADITDYVDGLSGNTVRLVLVNKFASGGTVYDMKFDDLTSFPKATGQIENAPYSTSYGYRVGGAPSGVTGLSSAEDHTTGSGQSFCLVRNYSYDRFKLYNTLKTSDMTEADIGTTYHVTLWVKSAVAISLSMGVMSPYGDSYGSNYCGTTSSTSLAAGEWTKCELVYTITEKNFVKATDGTISEVACLLTIQGTGVSNIYVDDVKVEIVSTDVDISSREGTSAPTLYVDNNKGAVAIGKTQYTTFAEALADVPTDGTATTITLQEDVTLKSGFSVPAGMNLTIDLNGYTMSGTDLANVSSFYAPIGVKGSLKIGNGDLVITGGVNYTFHVWNSGADNGAYLEFTEGLNLDSTAPFGIVQVGNQTANEGTFVMRDGVTVKTINLFIYTYSGSDATIYGGNVENTAGSMIFFFQGNNEKVVYGGTYKSVPSDDRQMFRQATGLVLKGGTYSEKPIDGNGSSVKVGNGYALMDNGDGTYTVRKIKTVVIGNVGYETLNAAVAAVPTDGTLTVLEVTEDTEIATQLTIAAGKNILLDLGGYTVNVTDTTKSAPIMVHGSLAIKNGTVKDELGLARQWTFHVYGDKNTKLELLDGAIIDSNADYGTIQLGKDNTVTALDAHLIVHDGATITTGWLNIHANAGAKVTIYGGSFINPVRSYLLHFIGNDSITADRYICGGTFTGNVTDSMYWAFAGAQNVTITGGTFNSQLITNEKISVPVADNHVVIENEDGTRTVKKLCYIGEPTDFTYVSQIEPDSNFGNQSKVILSGENGKNTIVLAEFDVSELANLNTLYIPVCGTGDQKISVAVIDGWAFDASTVTYNNVQDKLWAELMTTEKAAKHVGRYTIGTKALEIDAEDILSLVTGDTFTLVLQADEKYVFDLNFNDRSELSISEGASQGIIGNTETLNVPYDSTYMAARGGYTSGCKIAFASAMDKDGKDSMMFRVTKGGQRYRFYNLFSTDTLTVLDIGRTFCISFDVMTTIKQSNSLNVGLHCRKSGDGITSPTSGGEDNEYKNYAANWRYKDQKVTTNANEWKTYTFEVTIDEFMVNHQIGMLCLNFGNIGSTEYFYIDNIKAEEIGGNETATATTFTAALPVAFVGEKEQISLGEGVTIIETSASMNTTDTDATYTDVIVHGRDSLVRVDNKTGALQIAVNGSFYSLCDAKGNVYTVGTESMPIAAILDKSAGTARYAANGKLAYYLDGTNVVNTYGTVAVFGGYTEALSVGAMSNPHGALTVSDTAYNTVASDVPTVVGTQMSTINNSVRVLSGIHSLYYSEIGFRAVRGDGTTKEWKTSVVFTSVNALGKEETAESLGCKYLSGFIVNGLEEATNGDTFTVTPLVYIGDQAIEGEAVTFTIAVEGGTITVSSNK